MSAMRTPVALLLFNRPELTAQVFQRVRAARPPRLLVVADGPRNDHSEDLVSCAAARAVTEPIDWPCEVHRNYADVNLGLKRRVESGLDWLFAQVDRAIILEDDCLPDPSFFPYCEELLDRYADDDRVMTIGGSRLTADMADPRSSYVFSRYPLIWGWATWRRAWQFYDGTMRAWPAARDSRWLETFFADASAARYWAYVMDSNFQRGDMGSWDYAWLLASWLRGGLSAMPSRNLVSNLGFGPGATNTTVGAACADMPAQPMHFPMTHPVGVDGPDAAEDRRLERQAFSGTLDRLMAGLRERICASSM